MGMTRKSSPISMQMKGSNLDRHTPRVYTSYAARYPDAGRATDLDIEKACPWPMEEYERALNCEYSLVRQNGAVLTNFDIRHR